MENEELRAWFDVRFDVLIERMDQRFDQVDRRLEGHDRKFEQHDQRFEQVHQRLGKLDVDVRQNGVQIEAVRGDVRQLAETVSHVNSRVYELGEQLLKEIRGITDFYELTHRSLGDRVETHDRQIADLDIRVTALEKDKNA